MHTVDLNIHDGTLHLVDDIFRGAGVAVLINLNIQSVAGIDIQFIAQQVGLFVIQGGILVDRVYKLLVTSANCGSAQRYCNHRNHQQRTEKGHHFFHDIKPRFRYLVEKQTIIHNDLNYIIQSNFGFVQGYNLSVCGLDFGVVCVYSPI